MGRFKDGSFRLTPPYEMALEDLKGHRPLCNALLGFLGTPLSTE